MEDAKKRRETVPAACEKCRRRKVKCDGQRPCRGCVNLGADCVYAARGGETHRQAQKRKYDDLASLHDSLRALDENDALALFRRIRAGDSLESLLTSVPASAPPVPTLPTLPTPPSRDSQAQSSIPAGHPSGASHHLPSHVDDDVESLTSAIVAARSPTSRTIDRHRDGPDHARDTSTADGSEPISADLLIDIMSELKGRRRAVGLEVWERLRRCSRLPTSRPQEHSRVEARRPTTPVEATGRISLMQTLLRGSATLPAIVYFLESNDWRALDFDMTAETHDAMQRVLEIEAGGHHVRLRGSIPSHKTSKNRAAPPVVPAAPWTSVTDDSRLVSHLISLFLAHENSAWRFLERDPFLEDMRLGKLDAEYCSPLLVNAACALACMGCTEQGAFPRPGNWFQRGQHFYNEAIRLWLNEMGRPSLTTIQALGILCVRACYCAKDRFGISLLSVAIQMNQDLPWPASDPTKGGDADVAERVRTCAAWATHNLNIGTMMGLYKPAAPIDPRLGITPNLPDEVRTWKAFPLNSPVFDFRPNVLLRERCMLFRLCAELTHLLFDGKQPSDLRILQHAVQTLDERLRQWRDNLPTDLRYDVARPAPIYELHLQFLCATTTLWSVFDGVGDAPADAASMRPDDSFLSDIRKTANLRKYEDILSLTRWLADHRREYTLETAGSYCIQAGALTSFVALKMLAEYRNGGSIREDLPEGALDGLERAFEESFRCTLGTGSQLSLAAGVARMVVQTATQLNALPRSVVRALTAIRPMLDDAHRPKDTSSAYVNYALAARAQADEDTRMDEILRKADNMSM